MRLMPQCQFFSTDGKCSNGDDCDFLHLKPEEHVRDCPWYKRGFCKHGPKCRNRHVRNEPCFDYLAGFCINGPKCKFGQ
jgi:cleavage and polyadenylation specificity factor subunit 4